MGHSGTSAAEPLHPDVSGTRAGVSVCLSSPKLNKGETIVILGIVFILPFPIAALPPAVKFTDGLNPCHRPLCLPPYRWSPSVV